MAIAPLGAPIAVVIAQIFQNRWQQRFAERQLAASRQNFQLAAMDKRVAALHALIKAERHLYIDVMEDDTREDLERSLIAGQLVFDPDVSAKLEAAWKIHYRLANALMFASVLSQDDPERERFDIEVVESRDALRKLFAELRVVMVDSGRAVFNNRM